MGNNVKLALWIIVGLIALAIIYWIVSIVFSIVFTIVQWTIYLGVSLVILYLLYYVITGWFGDRGSSTTTERERLFE